MGPNAVHCCGRQLRADVSVATTMSTYSSAPPPTTTLAGCVSGNLTRDSRNMSDLLANFRKYTADTAGPGQGKRKETATLLLPCYPIRRTSRHDQSSSPGSRTLVHFNSTERRT